MEVVLSILKWVYTHCLTSDSIYTIGFIFVTVFLPLGVTLMIGAKPIAENTSNLYNSCLFPVLEKKKENEQLVLIAKFHVSENVPDTELYNRLKRQLISAKSELNLTTFRVLDYPKKIYIDSEDEAEEIRKKFDADLLIIGEDTQVTQVVKLINKEQGIFTIFTDDQLEKIAGPLTYKQIQGKYLPESLKCLTFVALSAALHNQNKFEKAAIATEAALSTLAEDVTSPIEKELLWLNLGTYKSYLGDYDGALKAYDNGIKMKPNNSDHYGFLYLSIGGTYVKKENYQDAIANYSEALKKNLSNPLKGNILFLRASAYARENLPQKAVDDYNIAIDLIPEKSPDYYNLRCYRAINYLGLNELKKAEIDIDFIFKNSEYLNADTLARGMFAKSLLKAKQGNTTEAYQIINQLNWDALDHEFKINVEQYKLSLVEDITKINRQFNILNGEGSITFRKIDLSSHIPRGANEATIAYMIGTNSKHQVYIKNGDDTLIELTVNEPFSVHEITVKLDKGRDLYFRTTKNNTDLYLWVFGFQMKSI